VAGEEAIESALRTYSFCASTITSTLSFGVGFEGSTPRKERKDFPDCSGAILIYGLRSVSFFICSWEALF